MFFYLTQLHYIKNFTNYTSKFDVKHRMPGGHLGVHFSNGLEISFRLIIDSPKAVMSLKYFKFSKYTVYNTSLLLVFTIIKTLNENIHCRCTKGVYGHKIDNIRRLY